MSADTTKDVRVLPSGNESVSISKGVKVVLLMSLCMQNAGYTMLRRYSIGILGEKWSCNSVLLVGEFMKLACSTVMTLVGNGAPSNERTGSERIRWLLKTSYPMAMPAVVFWVMNQLSYQSLKRLDSSTFTVIAQMKVLTTAFFSMIIMGRTFPARKCRALILLVLGVVLVSNGSYKSDSHEVGPETKTQFIMGVGAVLAEVTLSGFVNVYFENMLKSRTSSLSLWDRNVQLAMYSLVFCIPAVAYEDGAVFDGWTANAVILSSLGSAGGLLVALAMKYTDAVFKTFATSGGIVVTAVAGYMLLSSPLDVPIAVGAGCTVLSLFDYSDNVGLPPTREIKTGANSKTPALSTSEKKSDPSEDTDEENVPLMTKTNSSAPIKI